MKKDEKSERSRRRILEVALDLFSRRGYRATSVRDMAEQAGLSTGNVYHHFPDKISVFRALLQQFAEAVDAPDFPLQRAIGAQPFPDNLEAIGRATEEVVRTWRRHVALIYVDMIEFDGAHMRSFYAGMATRVADALARNPDATRNLAPDIDPVAAILIAIRFFLSYFTIELLFGVPNHFGKSSEEVIRDIARIFRGGVSTQ
ncbi:MAG: TetR/AcrR family transcriptional regulator [Thermoanaerobaculia bacterium]